MYHSCTPRDRLSILLPVVVNAELSVTGVVDTASQVTVLSEEVYLQMVNPPQVLEHVYLRGAAKDGRFQARRLGTITLRMGDREYSCSPYVAPISDPLLVGLDFLSAHEGVIDVADQSVSLAGAVVPTRLVNGGESSVRTVRLSEDCVFPARSCQLVKCLPLQTPVDQQGSALIVDLDVGPDRLSTVPTLIPVGAQVFLVPIFNDGDSDVSLPALSVVAQAEDVHDVPESAPVDCDRASQEERLSQPTPQNSGVGCVRSVDTMEDTSVPAHLQSLFLESSKGLTDSQVLVLKQLLIDYADVFAMNDQDLGLLHSVKHRIDTGEARPIKEPMRRTPLGFEGEEEKHLADMLRNGIVRPSFSSWASPPVLVRKKDGSVRWCIDYRRLNDVTLKDVFPLPLIEQCLDTLSGHSWYSSLDMASGYWQLEIAEEDKPKTAFITKFGLFEHNRMAFGLCNAPATFQRAIQLVLADLLWRKALAYIDDVIVLGTSFEDHISSLKAVLDRFRLHNLKLKPRKCHLFKRQLEFLGHVVSEDGVSVAPAKIDKVLHWPVPRTVTELQSFLGFVNYHRNHLENLARVAQPLYALAQTKGALEWTEEHDAIFEQLKSALVSAPVLAFPIPDGQFILDTDASDGAIGAVLSQVQGEETHVIAYASNSKAQQNYCTTRKELLAVVHFTRLFRHYLLGRQFMVRTDHGSLTWLLRFKQIGGQLARWLEELSQFDMVIVHRPGRVHQNADGLSRIPLPDDACDCYRAGSSVDDLPCGGCTHCRRMHKDWARFEDDVDDVVPLAVRALTVDPRVNWCDGYSTADLVRMQRADPALCHVIEWLESDAEPPDRDLWLRSAESKEVWLNRSLLELGPDSLLQYRWEREEGVQKCLVVPRALVRECMALLHEVPGGGHYGDGKTVERARQKFWWPFMARDCRLFVQGCDRCNASKYGRQSARAGLGVFHAGVPLERVHLDILGPFPESRQGNRYVLMVVDQFTKWVECLPLPNQSASEVATAFVNEFVSRLGCPLQVHTDQGTNFESELFLAVCSLLRIAKTRTTPYRPCSNGQVERMNRTLLGMVRCFVEKDHLLWDTYVPQLAGAIRATPNRTTGFSPNFLMLGREVTSPADLLLPVPGSEDREPVPYAQDLLDRMREVHEVARKHIKDAQQVQKKTYDLRLAQRSYEEGDLVYAIDTSRQAGVGSKLKPIWRGPCLVEEVLSPVVYRVRDRRRSQVLHHDRLKPCRDRSVPTWLRRLRRQLLAGEPLDAPTRGRAARASPDADEDECLADIRHLFARDAGATPPLPIPAPRTRAGRPVVAPGRLRDYV